MAFNLSVLFQHIFENVSEWNYIFRQNIASFQSVARIAFTFEINSVTSVDDLVTNVTEESDHRTWRSKKNPV